MADVVSLTPQCGAQTRGGGKCQRPAGWGTDHPGFGRCKLHAGMAPNGRRAGNREMALAEARAMLGSEIDVDPFEAILQAVRLAAGQTAYYRRMIAARQAEGEDVDVVWRDGLEKATERQAKIAKDAIAAGVAERMVRLAERAADTISLVVEEAIAAFAEWNGIEVTVEHRTRLAGVVQAGLSRHEQQPVIEGREA